MTGLRRDQVIPQRESGEDPYPSGPPSLVREYLGTEPRKLLYSAGFIVGVMVVVTIPYVMLVGYDKWTSDMKEAGHMMWAGYTTPAAATGLAAAPPGSAPPAAYPYALPYGYGYSLVPAGGAPLAAAPAPAPTPLGRQYVCPTCGAVGLPRWSPSGQPLCPICGNLMAVAPLRWEAELAAAP
jgi:hypothetical protein